ncbi:CBASS cGAMP synthase [Lysobacter brunescens]|uniref:Cyclic GMP-AMP synthase n=1 Tax=Lysobacter brunescens TaxID=262323 RepID=A0ABW2YDA3_9GAMM
MLTLHKLFLNAGSPDSFDEVIVPTEGQRRTLVQAKNTIRDRLRISIRAATTKILGMDRMVDPRFRTQGSWAYRTCVQGAHLPPQEMDWDFGVYLPVTVWADQAPPPAMAKLYFDLVEQALDQLCGEQGWKLDRSNLRCVRVKITDWAHIDIPLYAAPEDKFREVAEKAVTMASANAHYYRESMTLDESADFGEMPEQFWELMEDIHLATRDGKWVPSDPEMVAKWFDDRIEEHGEQLRRVCRYLKAWRDHHWRDGGGPSSVLLMIIVARNFQSEFRRDDLALERAANHLARELNQDVRERGIDNGEEDFNRMSAADRKHASGLAETLARQIYASRHYGPGLMQAALDNMRIQFGPRISNNRDLVQPDSGAEVRSTPAAAVAPPLVQATKAG